MKATYSLLHPKARIVTILFLFTISTLSAQYQQIIIGGGVAPIHKSTQSDFRASQIPYNVHLQYQRGSIGARVDHYWNNLYQKENFSFTTSEIGLTMVYADRHLLKTIGLLSYARLGMSKWNTDFTTEGYPGITDYTLKVERDSGYGVTGGLGILYPYKNFNLGIEGQYARNGTAQFIAGGFEPQPLQTGQIRLMLTAQYRLPITITSPKGYGVLCPTF